METAKPALAPEPAAVLPFPTRPHPLDAEKRAELLLDALKRAMAEPGEHRLFRAGKLSGLFPSRIGLAADASLHALTDGLLEVVRTETKGRLVVEWVRVTPRGVTYVHDRDSPKAVLRELRDVIGETRQGIPVWMDEARRQIEALTAAVEQRGDDLIRRLDALSERVESALRRAEAVGLSLPDPVRRVVPWAVTALEYLDRRAEVGSPVPCPLNELFQAIQDQDKTLTLPTFQQGLRRLHDVRALKLVPSPADRPVDPEYVMMVDHLVCGAVER